MPAGEVSAGARELLEKKDYVNRCTERVEDAGACEPGLSVPTWWVGVSQLPHTPPRSPVRRYLLQRNARQRRGACVA